LPPFERGGIYNDICHHPPIDAISRLGELRFADMAFAQSPSPEDRAKAAEERMTDEERFGLIHSLMVVVLKPDFSQERDKLVPESVPQIAGWVKGVPRLGVPDLLLTDAGLGITNPGGGRKGDQSTALPSAQMLAATFNPRLAYDSGVILGREARARNFNAVLAGGMNLARDPRHGRNFEYFSEDPWLSAVMAAETVKGVQAQNVIGMLKHVSLNSQEINKWFLDARIDPSAHRESELLAFQIGIERGNPGSLMCAYNKVNGEYACGNDTLLNREVKGRMDFKGFIMSDWKAVYGWDFAVKDLDQHYGAQVDEKEWFAGPLREAYAQGRFPTRRVSRRCGCDGAPRRCCRLDGLQDRVRKPRPRGPELAPRAGAHPRCGDRREPEHGRRPEDRQPCRDALARAGAGGHCLVVLRQCERSRAGGNSRRQDQSVGTVAGDVLWQHRPDTASDSAGFWHADEHAGDACKRLLGFERVELKPGESRRVSITSDPRLLAKFDREANQWRVAGGPHRVAVGRSADELVATADVTLRARLFGR